MLFQSLNRAYKRSDEGAWTVQVQELKCFNPSIGLTSVPTRCHPGECYAEGMFQSLNRAYKRSDLTGNAEMIGSSQVSIPQSGLQAFRLAVALTVTTTYCRFNPSIGLTSVPTAYVVQVDPEQSFVSIPQSGLQAFRLNNHAIHRSQVCRFNPSIGLTSVPTAIAAAPVVTIEAFQSLNRAYKRSDWYTRNVSLRFQCFNPSIGLTSVPTKLRKRQGG